MSAFARTAIDTAARNARGPLGQGIRDVVEMCSVVIGQVFMRHQLQLGTASSLVVHRGVLGLLRVPNYTAAPIARTLGAPYTRCAVRTDVA